MYSKSATGNFSVKCFERIYSDAIINLDTMPVAFVSSLSANSIPDKVERNAFINSLPKSYDKTKVPEADADGKIDFKDAAVKVGAAKLENGNLVFPSFYDVCNIFESTRLGYEQYMMNKAISDKLISGAIQIVPFSDKILYADNDGDGIANKDDPYLDEHFDDRFLIVGDYNYYPKIDFMDIEKYGTGSTEFEFDQDKGYYYGIPGEDGRTLCYGRNEITSYDTSMYCLLFLASTAAILPITDVIAGKVSVDKFIRMPSATSFLFEFLSGNCKKLELNDIEMRSIIASHPNNLYH